MQLSEHPKVAKAVQAHGDMIAREILADDIQLSKELEGTDLALAEDIDVQASIERA